MGTQQPPQKSQKKNPNIMLKLKIRRPSSPPQMKRNSESLHKCNAPSIQTGREISKRKLPSGSSCSKPSAGLGVSGSDINEERTRKKLKCITEVTREAPKAAVHPASIALQTKKMTGHIFKSRLKMKMKKKGGQKKIVPEDSALGKSEKLMDCQGIEERVHSDSSKKRRRMEKKSPQCSPNRVESGLDLLLAEEDTTIEDHHPLQQKPSLEIKEAGGNHLQQKPSLEIKEAAGNHLQQKPSLEIKEAAGNHLRQKPSLEIKEAAGNSTNEEHSEGPATLQQNLALENKSSGSDAGSVLIDLQKLQKRQKQCENVQKKCDTRMKNIIRDNEEKIQKVQQFWENENNEEKLRHQLKVAVTRTIWGKGSVKLEIEDDKLAKKVAENDLLKEKELTDLKAERQAKIKEEIQMSAPWLSVAKAAISRESKTHIPSAKDVVTSTKHREITKSIKTVRGKQVVQSNNSDCAKAKELGYNAPNGNPSNSENSCQKIEGGITLSDILIPAVVEQINQPKHLGNGESICANLPALGERVLGEMQSLELHGDVNPVVSLEIVDNANPVDLSTNTPIEGFGKGGANDLPDAEKLTQPKHFGCGERIFANLQNSGGSVPGEMQSLELHVSVPAELPETVANENVDNVNPVNLSTNIPIEGFGEEHAIDLPDAELLNQPKHFGSGERIFANLPDSGEKVPGEMLSLAELPETAANELVDNANPVDLITNTPTKGFGEEDAIDLPGAELLTQPKHFESGERIFANLPDSGERDPGEIQSLVPDKDIPAELAEIVDDANPVELSINTSFKEFGKRDAIYFPDALLNKRTESDGSTIDYLNLAGQVLKTPEQTKASPHPCLMLPLQVHEAQDLVSYKRQNHGVQVVGKVNSSPSEVVMTELADTATNFISNIEPQELEEPATRTEIATAKIIDTVIAEQSSSINLQDQDASVVKDQVTLQIEVTDSERVATEAPFTLRDEVEPESQHEVAPSETTNSTTPARSSTDFQDEGALIAENQAVLEIDISNSGLADNATPVQVQSHNVAPEIDNCEQVRLMPVDESPSCNQFPLVEFENQIHNPVRNSSGAAETHVSTSQLREYVEPQSNYLDVGPESQSSHATSVELSASFQTNVATEGVASTTEIPHQDILQLGDVIYLPGQEAAARNPPSTFSVSLQKELESINKETEELQKSFEDTESLLQSECAKEILDVRNKYELKLQDAREQSVLKKNGLIKKQNKILMNKSLADAWSYNCLWSTWPPIMLESYPSSPTQYLQHVVRPVEATARPPAPNQQITNPFRQAVQPRSVLHSTRLVPATNQRFPDRPEQFSQHAAAAISRPQVINAVHHPASYPHFGGAGIYSSSTPHYQASRPAAASMDVTTMLPTLRNLWHQQQQQQQQQPPLAALQWLPSFQNSHHIGQQPVLSQHASISALGLLTDIQHHPQQHRNHTSMNSNFGSLQQSHLDTTLGNVQGNQRFSAAALLTDIQHHPQQPGNHTSMNSSFGSLQQSRLDTTLGNVQGNQRFSAAASNVICLSDDE